MDAYKDYGDIHMRSVALFLGSERHGREWRDLGLKLHYLRDPAAAAFDAVAISAERMEDAERACRSVESVFHLDARPCAEAEVPDMFRQWKREFYEGFPTAMRSDFPGWRPKVRSMRVGKAGKSLIVRRGPNDCAILSLSGGSLSLERLRQGEFMDFERLCPFSESGMPGDLGSWLGSFLPEPEFARLLLIDMGEWDDSLTHDGKFSPEGLFAFFSRFGTHLAGTISFVNPAWLSGGIDGCERLFLPRDLSAWPGRFAAHPVFPGQAHGFAADFYGGAWDSLDGCGSCYAIPFEDRGRGRMAWRILSLSFAELIGIPSVGWRPVEIPIREGGHHRAIAFSRFDLRAGKPVFRVRLKSLPDDERERALAGIGAKGAADLDRRIRLGRLLCFDGSDATIIEARADLYPSEDLLEDGPRIPEGPSLGDFQGATAEGRMSVERIVESWKGGGDAGDALLLSIDLWRLAARHAALRCPWLAADLERAGDIVREACGMISQNPSCARG